MPYLISKFSFLTRICRDTPGLWNTAAPNFHMSWCQLRYFAEKGSQVDNRSLIRISYFDQIENRTKETYLEMVNIYKQKERLRRGHVEFIYSALKHMQDFGVEKDLEVYKSLIDVFPKGKMIPKNIFQVEFMHYPKHQQCAIDLLEQMEENGVIPDWNMEDQLVNAFGTKGYPVRRYWRMMYWMPKWKNASPFPLPRPLPSDSLQLAELAIQRITEVDVNSQISIYQTSKVKDSVDDTWIVSGQSDEQQQLIEELPDETPLYVEGPFRIWLRNVSLSYFLLRTEPMIKPNVSLPEPENILEVTHIWSKPTDLEVNEKTSVHQQEDGTILAVCATGTSSRDSLLSWLRSLQLTNPRLSSLPVLFRLVGKVKDDNETIAIDSQETAALLSPLSSKPLT